MNNKISRSEIFSSLMSPAHLELLEALLEPEDAAYPWNPNDEESDTYFHQAEQEFVLNDLLEAELTSRSQEFYNYLDPLWHENTSHDNDTTKTLAVDYLQEILHSNFAAAVPQVWLQTIAQKAANIFSSPQSTGEKLVECVQVLLPDWGIEDLLVLARPFAYAMRSSEQHNVVSVINNIHHQEWDSLSETEQAKYSLAIACLR